MKSFLSISSLDDNVLSYCDYVQGASKLPPAVESNGWETGT